MADCVFCKIVKEEVPSHIVYEDSTNMAFLDIVPVDVGHTQVITKKHYSNFLEVPNTELTKTINVVDKVARAVLKATGAPSFKIVINSGKEAGQIIEHFHVHIIPYFKEGRNLYRKTNVDSEELKRVAEKIKRALR